MTDELEIVETLPPLHPGEVLREEFMVPLGLTAGMVAKALNLPRTRIERIVREEIGISTDTAMRLGRLFNVSPGFWLGLQTRFETETLLPEIGAELERITPVSEAA
ncbi:HigA family addiction module antitoxin [Methylobacterium aquaticum]|mgnify:CR=1 FL=1|jgi:addiction module HigA family antidote|uniref:XRE family transcriptional regulator n=1 Tax=Methylobacterium aquaticum TaxID=270351 RepID=A0A0J6SGU6_9HYPH|nr:HigA family addiction module antitoxin [Methylobacterium aquaticum]KMO32909.1 XRE family transcriptional regulator [Methylobacterium aquaticum]